MSPNPQPLDWNDLARKLAIINQNVAKRQNSPKPVTGTWVTGITTSNIKAGQAVYTTTYGNIVPVEPDMKPGDKVKFKEDFYGSAPDGMADSTFTVQCVHPSIVFLLSEQDAQQYGGNRCTEHGFYWEARKAELRVVGKVGTKKKVTKIDDKQLDRAILKPDIRKDIVSLLHQGSKSDIIFDKWGLGETIEYGKGLTFLFWGPPGTGKTWTAHCMAKAIGKELMVLAVGQIQSSMAGETNKNIEKAFKAAKEGDKILLLDEADSFVGDRKHLGMILGSEINTLLQQIEQYEGILILTTNQIGSLDPALERRLALITEFKNPTKEERIEIWKTLLPEKFPLAKDVTAEALAEFKLTGGFIKNVLLHAARLAVVDDGKEVKMEHFAQAIKRAQESQGKMGTRGMHAVTDYKISGSN